MSPDRRRRRAWHRLRVASCDRRPGMSSASSGAAGRPGTPSTVSPTGGRFSASSSPPGPTGAGRRRAHRDHARVRPHPPRQQTSRTAPPLRPPPHHRLARDPLRHPRPPTPPAPRLQHRPATPTLPRDRRSPPHRRPAPQPGTLAATRRLPRPPARRAHHPRTHPGRQPARPRSRAAERQDADRRLHPESVCACVGRKGGLRTACLPRVLASGRPAGVLEVDNEKNQAGHAGRFPFRVGAGLAPASALRLRRDQGSSPSRIPAARAVCAVGEPIRLREAPRSPS
jgi:hypothetical protein